MKAKRYMRSAKKILVTGGTPEEKARLFLLTLDVETLATTCMMTAFDGDQDGWIDLWARAYDTEVLGLKWEKSDSTQASV